MGLIVIHKERVAIPVTDMEPGLVFYDGAAHDIWMVTDDIDPEEDGCVMCVNLSSGVIVPFYSKEIAQPLRLSMVEVKSA